ncbi:MAG: Holliday junction branch migration protein RuvA [Endomicrobiales bacterium]|nr:Holliday junction branch migration protein RuvA [Endomicrobiales bacterium]
MITHLRGILSKKSINQVIVDVNGVGYEVIVPQSISEKLPALDREVKLFIVESVSMYGGGTTLYGFLSEEEKEVFQLLKDEIPGAGAKKSLDYYDKISKSLPDFRKAIMTRNVNLLTGIFGFTKKTAEKIISALKDKIINIQVADKEKWSKLISSGVQAEAIAGLVALGYKETQARGAVEQVLGKSNKNIRVEEVIKQALSCI